MAQENVIASTLRGLMRPRRLLPIGLVCLPVVGLEAQFGWDPWGVLIAALMSLFYPTLAPLTWRALLSRAERGWVIRVVAYAAAGMVCVGAIGVLLPRLLEMQWTLVTDTPILLAQIVVWWVGGWSLGRDIDQETELSLAIQRNEAIAREAAHAQLLAIQSHLDPHFLFNTLNAIAEWCAEDPKVAEEATLRLSNMLRVILEGVKVPTWPLSQELGLVEDLVALYRIRDPDKVRFEKDVPAELLDAPVPPMMLLNLAENAIKHGPWAGHAGAVTLYARRDADHIRIRMRNPGPFNGPRAGSEGLPLLHRRLEVAYEGHAQFEIGAVESGTEAELLLPMDGGLAT